MTTKKQTSQKPPKNTRTTGWNTNRPASRPAPSTKSTSRPVKAQFKAGKDL